MLLIEFFHCICSALVRKNGLLKVILEIVLLDAMRGAGIAEKEKVFCQTKVLVSA